MLSNEFAKLLNEFLSRYIPMIVAAGQNREFIGSKNAKELIYYLKLFRNILPECGE